MSIHFGAETADSVHGFCRTIGMAIGGAICMLHVGEGALSTRLRCPGRVVWVRLLGGIASLQNDARPSQQTSARSKLKMKTTRS